MGALMRTGIVVAVMFIALLAAAIVVVYLVRIPDMYAVSGSGEIKFVPDVARIEAGVVAQSDNSLEATQRVSEGMQAVFAALKAAGIAENDIAARTLLSKPNEQDRYRDAGAARAPFYVAEQTVLITVRDLKKLSGVLSTLTDAGSNSWRVEFLPSDPDKLEVAARQDALKDAMKRADAYAADGGFARGRVLKLVDSETKFPSADFWSREYYITGEASGSRVEKVTVTGSRGPVRRTTFFVPTPQEETVTAKVDVLFEIK